MSEKKYYLLSDAQSGEAFGPFSKEDLAELDLPESVPVCVPAQQSGLKPAKDFPELANLVISVGRCPLKEQDTKKTFYIKHGKQYSEHTFNELKSLSIQETTPIGIGTYDKWYYAGNILGLNEMLRALEEAPAETNQQVVIATASEESDREFDLSDSWKDFYKQNSNKIATLLKAYLDVPVDPSCFVHLDFSEEYLKYKRKAHERAFVSIKQLLDQICPVSLQILNQFESDLATLDGLRIASRLRPGGQHDDELKKVIQHKKELGQLLENIKSELIPLVHECLKKYFDENIPYFPERWELAPADSPEWKDYKPSFSMPLNTVYLGKECVHFTFFEENLSVPRLLYKDILNTTNLVLYYQDDTEDLCYSFINSILGHYLAATQPGKMSVKVFDPKGFTGTSDAFRKVLGYNSTDLYIIDIHGRGFLDGILQEISERRKTLARKETVAQYNANPTNRLFKIAQQFYLIIGEMPEREHELAQLNDILRAAPACGICLVFLTKDTAFKLPENLPVSYYHFEGEPAGQDNATAIEYSLLSEEQLKLISQSVKTDYLQNKNIVKFSDFQLPKKLWWESDCSDSAYVPFGLDYENAIVDLAITQKNAQNTAVVIGTSGFGKSVFLHDIILSAAMKYSPDQLQMYLIDFSGTEFKVYVPDAFSADEDNQYHLPHALVVAPEVEREFGLSILKRIDEEATNRQMMEVNSFPDYNRNHPEKPLPRILVIIDEYQKFFDTQTDRYEDAICVEARKCITRIIKEYRKFGINLILATQELINSATLPYGLIGNRIVFNSKPLDFQNLIGDSSMPKLDAGVCVYNNDSGRSEGNRIVHSFFVSKGERAPIVKDIYTHAVNTANLGILHPTVFKARELPDRKNLDRYDPDHRNPTSSPGLIHPYIGESIEISKYYLHFPLTKDASNNILIAGGDNIHHVPEAVARGFIASTTTQFSPGEAQYYVFNFLDSEHPTSKRLHQLFDDYEDFAVKIVESDYEDSLSEIKEIKDRRKKDLTPWIFLLILGYDRTQVFAKENYQENKALAELIDIIDNGPAKGITTIVQTRTLALVKEHLGVQKLKDCFNHKIVFQMSESDSQTTINSIDASLFSKIDERVSAYRGLYHNNQSGQLTKFRPFDDADINKKDLNESDDQ